MSSTSPATVAGKNYSDSVKRTRYSRLVGGVTDPLAVTLETLVDARHGALAGVRSSYAHHSCEGQYHAVSDMSCVLEPARSQEPVYAVREVPLQQPRRATPAGEGEGEGCGKCHG